MNTQYVGILERIGAIAREGSYYAQNPFDKDRYHRLQEIVTQEFASILNISVSELAEIYGKDFGCITPKVGVDVLIRNKVGEVLILNRSRGNGWCLPCGWIDVGESPEETAVREVFEETGSLFGRNNVLWYPTRVLRIMLVFSIKSIFL